MAKVRTLEKSIKTGALLAGIPLLIAGLMPFTIDPLQFAWDIAKANGSVEPLVPAAAGFMLTAVGLIPGLPRLLRALLVLGFSGGVVAFLVVMADGGGPGGNFDLSDPPTIALLGAFLLATVAELLMQARKTSKAFTALALVGWVAFLAWFAVPWNGGEAFIINLFEGLPRLFEEIGNSGAEALAAGWPIFMIALVILIALLAMIFAFVRLIRAPEGMVRSPFKSGWIALLVAGMPGIIMLGSMFFVAVSTDEAGLILPAFSMGFVFWGMGVGVVSGLAHTILGIMPMPTGATSIDRPVYDPSAEPAQQAAQPQPTPQPQAQPQAQPLPQPTPAPLPQQQPQPNPLPQKPDITPGFDPFRPMEPQAHDSFWQGEKPQGAQQPQAQPQSQPQTPAPKAQPIGPTLQEYPGYPGYVVCPNCRGGVASKAPVCTHCGHNIDW